MLVEADLTANDTWIAQEAGVPVGIGKHDIRSAVGTTFIGGMEQSAQIGMNPQHVEVVARGAARAKSRIACLSAAGTELDAVSARTQLVGRARRRDGARQNSANPRA